MDKSKLMLIIIIVLLVLLLGTVGFVTFFLISMSGDAEVEVDEIHRPVIGVHPRLPDLEQVELGSDQITTHLAHGADGRTGTAIVRIVAGIDVSDDGDGYAFIAEFERRIEMARSIAIEVLNGLSYDEVRTPEGQFAAREMIRIRLQESFETNLIVSIHFSDWLAVQGR